MRTTMDAAGRLVVPTAVRRQFGVMPDVPLDVRCDDGRIEIELAPVDVRIERRGRLIVATPAGERGSHRSNRPRSSKHGEG